MPSHLRLLSWLFLGMHRLSILRWFVAIVLLLGGLAVLNRNGLQAALIVWGAAVALLLLGWIADLAGFVMFAPELNFTAPGQSAFTQPTLAVAAGLIRTNDNGFWLAPRHVEGIQVQVRWLTDRKPPALAVLMPADLPTTLKNPLDEAGAASLWYPGMDVAVGWVAVGYRLFPGIRLRFPGKQMILGFAHPEEALGCAERMGWTPGAWTSPIR